MATDTVPQSDDVALAEIADLADRLGKVPGRNKLMEEFGWGASRSSRLLQLYREQSGGRSSPPAPEPAGPAGPPAAGPGPDGAPEQTGVEPRSAPVVDCPTETGPQPPRKPDLAGPVEADHRSEPPVRGRSAQATPQTAPTGPGVRSAPVAVAVEETDVADRGPVGGPVAPGPVLPVSAARTGQTASERADRTAPAVRTERSGVAPVPAGVDRTGVDRQPWGLIGATLAISLSAFVAVWGGWVGLGRMAGFGSVNLLPGLGSGLHVNLAITLPIGIEAYAAAALYVAVAGLVAGRARWFAALSAGAALLLGAFGQAAYHLLEARGVETAPDGIVVFVSVLPVFVLGAAGVLLHLVLEQRKA